MLPNVDPTSHALPSKSICKWKREMLEKSLPLLVKQAANGRFICRKCARVVCDKQLVCKPIKISKLPTSSS